MESEGLITIVPRRGAFVVQLSMHDIEEIFELREALEVLVAKDAVLNEKILKRMRAAVMSAKQYREENDKNNYIRADAAFHTTLAEASSNSRLKKILENMRNQMLIVRSRTFELSSHTSVKQHLDILEALEQGNRDAGCESDGGAHPVRPDAIGEPPSAAGGGAGIAGSGFRLRTAGEIPPPTAPHLSTDKPGSPFRPSVPAPLVPCRWGAVAFPNRGIHADAIPLKSALNPILVYSPL